MKLIYILLILLFVFLILHVNKSAGTPYNIDDWTFTNNRYWLK